MHGWLHNLGWINLWSAVRTGADILVVWYLTYRLMMLAKGTRAWQIITGLLVFVCLLAFSSWAQLTAINWILQKLFYLGPVAIVILFFPELRHALEEVGRLGFWGKNFSGLDKEDVSELIAEITRAAETMAEKNVGALMVLERETGLTDIIETGTTINSVVNSELLQTIFYPGTLLHDGAVVIRRDRLVAAACTLPLSENPNIGTTVHTRHKAGLGITEQSDALAVIVSEERGTISLAFRGRMVALRGDDLRNKLIQELTGRDSPRGRRRGLRSRQNPQAAASSAPAANTSTPPPASDKAVAREPVTHGEAGR